MPSDTSRRFPRRFHRTCRRTARRLQIANLRGAIHEPGVLLPDLRVVCHTVEHGPVFLHIAKCIIIFAACAKETSCWWRSRRSATLPYGEPPSWRRRLMSQVFPPFPHRTYRKYVPCRVNPPAGRRGGRVRRGCPPPTRRGERRRASPQGRPPRPRLRPSPCRASSRGSSRGRGACPRCSVLP